MKGPQLAALIWLTNLGLLGGGGFLGYHVYSTAKAEQDDTYLRVQAPKPKEQRVGWLATGAQAASAGHQDLLLDKLSPRVRPPKKAEQVGPIKPPDPPPVKEPTDDELKAELQKWLTDKFSLLRILSGPPSLASAIVEAKDAGNAKVRLTTDMHFPTVFAKTKDNNLKKLAAVDLTVVAIQPDKVQLKCAAVNPKYKTKYFEVELLFKPEMFKKPDTELGRAGNTGPKVLETPPGPMPDPNVEVEDPRPTESTYDADTDTWTLGTDDYKNINTDELAKYAKVVHDKDGKPLGIQISEEAPDDNVVLARGGRRGDIIKAINGQAVTSMSDVRRVVRAEYNAGKEEITVDYERDGQPGRKIFRVPRKKNTEPNK